MIKADPMNHTQRLCKPLMAPAALRKALNAAGETRHFGSTSVLFRAGDPNAGVFLVCNGTVRLRVPGNPLFDRVFSAGSVLGLPSTFNKKPYSLTADCVTDCDVAQVGKQKFLDLMRACPDLCREATDMLSSEVGFILSAFRKNSYKADVRPRGRLCRG